MSFFLILWISISLGMDCFAVSISTVLCDKTISKNKILGMAFSFGLFQGGMTLLGYFIGSILKGTISFLSAYIASAILIILGLKMIHNSFSSNQACTTYSNKYFRQTLLLSLATSIDALAIGFSFAMIQITIYTSAFIIGVTSFIMSILGAIIGHFSCKKIKGQKTQIIGGLILIFIGIKNLL